MFAQFCWNMAHSELAERSKMMFRRIVLGVLVVLLLGACEGGARSASDNRCEELLAEFADASAETIGSAEDHNCDHLRDWVEAWEQQDPSDGQLGPMAGLLGYCGGVGDTRHPLVPSERADEPLCGEFEACVRQAGTILACEQQIRR